MDEIYIIIHFDEQGITVEGMSKVEVEERVNENVDGSVYGTNEYFDSYPEIGEDGIATEAPGLLIIKGKAVIPKTPAPKNLIID